MAELSQEQQSQILDSEAGLSIDEKLEKRLTEIKVVLDNINQEQVDPSLYTDILEIFTDEKKEELQELVDEVNDPLGKKTITRSTCFGYGLDLLVWQEVWMKDGVITKYGDFYSRGAEVTSVLGVGGGNLINQRMPLPEGIEFDAVYYCENVFFARPKEGQGIDNSIYAFGSGGQGQIGNGSTGNVWAIYASKYDFESRVKDIVFATEITTYRSCIALLENGSVWGTGRNVSGELGLGNTTQVNAWTKITDNADAIYAGSPALFVVKGTSLYACGANEQGALGAGDTTNKTTLTQIKTNVDVKKIKSMRYYDGSAVTASTFLHSGNRVYGAGKNTDNQIIAADTTQKATFVEITNNMGESIECGEGTDFAIGLWTNILLVPNAGNTDLWVAGSGENGYGDSAAQGTNKKRRKITTLSGTGWKCECPVKGYGADTMASSFFIYNEERKEIHAFGYNGGSACLLGYGDSAVSIRSLVKLTLPESKEQFEVSFGVMKKAGFYLCVVADGTLYMTGGAKSGMLPSGFNTLCPVVSAN